MLHVHTVIEECKIKSLVSGIGKDGKPNGVKPSFVKSKGSAIVKIKIRSKVCAEMYEKMRQLGRFTLRDEGTTIAIELS